MLHYRKPQSEEGHYLSEILIGYWVIKTVSDKANVPAAETGSGRCSSKVGHPRVAMLHTYCSVNGSHGVRFSI